MKQITNISQYKEIIEKYNIKGCFSNDYIQHVAADLIIQGMLFADYYEKNVFLFVKKHVGMRLYYYVNDVNEIADFENYEDLVVEILFRGELPQEEIDYLCKCGLHINLIRDQYAAMYKDLDSSIISSQAVVIEPARTLSDVQIACEQFNTLFDRLTGDFVPEENFFTLLNSHSILIARDKNENQFLGALHQIKEGAVNGIGHIVVMENARGKGVGNMLVDAFIEWNKVSEKTRYQLWVQRQNIAAVNMYKNKGFKFLNKSTISLIK